MNKVFCIGDIHGSYKGLLQCLRKSNFDYKNDTLICLGDVVDGWSQVKECFDELLKIKNLIYVIGNHDCVDKETECLTKRGWLKYNEINMDDEILSLNKKGYCEWSKINKIIIKEYSGDMIFFNTQHCNLLCTPNHRVLHSTRKYAKFDSLCYKQAKNLGGRVKIPISANNTNKGLTLSDNEIRFIAWILTDGHVNMGKKTHVNQYIIYQSKINNIKHIKSLLRKLGYKCNINIRDNKSKKSICGQILKNYLPSYVFRILNESNKKIQEYLPSKYPFPTFLYNMNQRQFRIFLNGIIRGDGSKYKHTKKACILYGTYDFLNCIQILCLMNNYRATLVKDNRGNYRLNISKHTSTQFDCYINKKYQKYDGEVWCLNVPYSNFMVRRNGRHYFTGNCWFLEWIITGNAKSIWTSQGGEATLKSYKYIQKNVPEEHINLLQSAKYYYVHINKKIQEILFVHGGIVPNKLIERQNYDDLLWDRELMKSAYIKSNLRPDYRLQNKYQEIFIGHTTTHRYNSEIPLHCCEVWNLDTGGGWEGKVSIMNIDTHEYWQSDNCFELYPEEKGRR